MTHSCELCEQRRQRELDNKAEKKLVIVLTLGIVFVYGLICWAVYPVTV